jgi:phosphoglycerate kinase
MERELKALGRVLHSPEKPCVYILGGAKADDSLKISQYVLKNKIADHILTGGVVGHLFLAAKGVNLGKTNMDFLEKKELMPFVPGIKELIAVYPGKVEVPVDLAVDDSGKRKEIAVANLPTNYPIYDIGTNTIKKYSEIIGKAKSIVISGPMGVYENKEFLKGTKSVFEAVTSSKAFSLAGGGHTIGALDEFGLAKKMGYVSTAGGALIEFLMGEQLPGVVALEKAAARS